MKLKNLLYLLLAMPLFVACNPVEELDPVLTLTSAAEINIAAEGGNGEIRYTLENPVTGIEVSATCEAAWVENLTAGATVTFTVGANEGEAREAKVVVSYASEKFEVAVKQAAKNAEPEPEPEPEPTGVQFTALKCEGEYYGTEYSDAHNYFTHFSDNGYDADGYMQPSSTYYIFDIYGPASVSEDGFITVPAGTYVYDATDSGAEGTFGHSYSAYVVIDATGENYVANEAFQSGTLVITENGATLTAVIAGVTHTMTYTGPVKIADTTAGEDPTTPGEGGEVEVTLSYASADFYGDYYTPGVSDNFYLTLSDIGLDAEGYVLPYGKYYRFDVYAPILDTNLESIPAGTYRVDVNESAEPWTLSSYYGAYYEMDEYGYDYVTVDYPMDGYLTVNEDGTMEAEYTLMISGEVHKITFDGELVINDIRDTLDDDDDDWGDEGWGEGPYSTLTEDITVDLSDHTLYFEYYGDYYEVGYRNWVIALIPNSFEGESVQFDVLGDENSITSFGGNYEISDSLGAFTAYPGYLDDGYLSGSWYYSSDGITMAPFAEGTIDVVDNGDGTASVEFALVDDLGYEITGSWSGEAKPASELNGAPSAAPAKAAVKASKAPKQAPAKVVKKESVVNKAKAPAKKGLSLWK